MEILKIRFRTNEEFQQYYDDSLGRGGLFCPTTTPLEVGQPVIVELSVPALPNKVLIRGVVRKWRPALPRLRVRAGATVEFDVDEASKRDFVLSTVRGTATPTTRRRHTRLPVAVPVRYRTNEEAGFVETTLTEISVGGAMLSNVTLPIGVDVVLEITPPGAVRPIPISGKTTYHGTYGGTGLKFIYRDGGGSRRLRELVRRLRLS